MTSSSNQAKKFKTIMSPEESHIDIESPELLLINPNTLLVTWSPKFILRHAFEHGAKSVDIQISAINGNIPRSRPSILYKELHTLIRNHKHITETRFTRNGSLIISANQMDCLLELINITSLLGNPVKTSILTSTLVTRYLLRDIDPESSLQEIATECAFQGLRVSRLVRFTRVQNGSRTPSDTILVEELGYHTRDFVYLWYTRSRVDVFIDRPRQCANCARFGHLDKHCGSHPRCFKCGGEHRETNCMNTAYKCPLCSEPHHASDKSCRIYQREMDILKYASTHHVSIQTARRSFPSSKTTYASISAPVSKPSCSCSAILPGMLEKLDKLCHTFEKLIPTLLLISPIIDRIQGVHQVTGEVPPRNTNTAMETLSTELGGLPHTEESSSPTDTLTKLDLEPPQEIPSHSSSIDFESMDDQETDQSSYAISAAERFKNSPRRKTRYMCDYCDLYFNASGALHAHMNTHFSDGKLQCPKCVKEFTKSAGLIKHLLSHQASSKGDRMG